MIVGYRWMRLRAFWYWLTDLRYLPGEIAEAAVDWIAEDDTFAAKLAMGLILIGVVVYVAARVIWR